jgi:hypothetical protein
LLGEVDNQCADDSDLGDEILAVTPDGLAYFCVLDRRSLYTGSRVPELRIGGRLVCVLRVESIDAVVCRGDDRHIGRFRAASDFGLGHDQGLSVDIPIDNAKSKLANVFWLTLAVFSWVSFRLVLERALS